MRRTMALIAAAVLTNFAFWLIWPASLVRAEGAGWSPTLVGVFGATTWLACLALLPIAPWLLHRFGRKPPLVWAVLCLMAAHVGYASGLGGAFDWLWAILLGFAFGVRAPILDAWVTDSAPAEKRGRTLALLETINGVAMLAGPAAAAVIGPGEHLALAGLGLALTLAAGLIILVVPSLPVATASTNTSVEAARPRGDGGLLLAVLLGAILLGGAFEAGFMAVGPMLAQSAGLGASEALLAASAVGLGSIAAQYPLGWASDRIGGARVLAVAALVLAATFALLAAIPASLVIAAVVIGGLGGSLYTVAAIVGLQVRPTQATQVMSASSFAYTFGGLAAPLLSGAAIDGIGATATVGIMAGLSLILGAMLIAMREANATEPSG